MGAVMKFRGGMLLLAIALTGVGAHAAIRIGNGGEGTCPDRSSQEPCHTVIYLRDLYQANLHLAPYLGDEIDPEIEKEVNASEAVRSIGISKSLLARKLTDLQKMQLHFGHIVLSAIEVYRWQFVDSALKLLPDDAPIEEIPDSWRVPVANRFQDVIRIDRAAWQLMPEVHKMALVIHEALYAMLRAQCGRGNCVQHAFIARDIVARVFSRSTDPQRAFSEIELGELNLSRARLPSASCPYHRESKIEISRRGRTIWASSQTANLKNFCSKNSALGGLLTIKARRQPFTLMPVLYPVRDDEGNPSKQLGLVLRYQAAELAMTYSVKTSQQCENMTSNTEGWNWTDGDPCEVFHIVP